MLPAYVLLDFKLVLWKPNNVESSEYSGKFSSYVI